MEIIIVTEYMNSMGVMSRSQRSERRVALEELELVLELQLLDQVVLLAQERDSRDSRSAPFLGLNVRFDQVEY
jgi:hypothetical protein